MSSWSGSLSDIFVSGEQVGSGVEQSVPHGLRCAPRTAFVVPTDTSPATVGVFTVTEGVHDTVSCKFTVTNLKKYRIVAVAY